MTQDLWTTRRDEVQQALYLAKETKRLAQAIKRLDEEYVPWGVKWEAESDALIASFKYFLGGNVKDCYVFAAWIDHPRFHLEAIKRTMRLFGVDVDTFFSYQPAQPTPQVEQQALF